MSLIDNTAGPVLQLRVEELAAENQSLREELARVDVQASQMELYVEQRSNDARRFRSEGPRSSVAGGEIGRQKPIAPRGACPSGCAGQPDGTICGAAIE